MEDFPNIPELPALVNAVIDGKVSAIDAGRGFSPAVETLLAISEKLGQLDRGKAIYFEPGQACLLHELLENATALAISGVSPTRAVDRIAICLMELAFRLDDPATWALRLRAIRDSPIGAGCGKPGDAPMTPERLAELSRKLNADEDVMAAYAISGTFEDARRLFDQVVEAISSSGACPDTIEWDGTTLRQSDVLTLWEEIHDRLGYIEAYLRQCARAHFMRVRDAGS